jgi:hypothetical protein
LIGTFPTVCRVAADRAIDLPVQAAMVANDAVCGLVASIMHRTGCHPAIDRA